MQVFTLRVVGIRYQYRYVLIRVEGPRRYEGSSATRTSRRHALLYLGTMERCSLVSRRVRNFMFCVIVNFLGCNRVVYAAFVRMAVFVAISQVGFRASVTRVFLYRPTNFPSVLSVALHATFSNRRRSFLGTKIYGSFRLVLSFLGDRFLAVGIIMTIGSTMRAMVLTVIYGVG